jgi:RNA polymerase sigma-70 factor (ECF subfamily)
MRHAGHPTATEVSSGGTNDQVLIDRARHGQAAAYDELYRRHRDMVARTTFLLIRNAEQAQDIAQEAFLIGWRDLRRLRHPEQFRAWVTGIALNLCRRSGRAEARQRRITRQAGAAELQDDATDAVANRVEVRRAVDALSRPLREAVVLRFYCGFAESEIAAALGVPVGTVKSRLGRAKARLAEALREVDR